jgi:hypothetical protein
VRLPLDAIACNPAIADTLATPKPIKSWSPTSLKEEVIRDRHEDQPLP